jgi:hypothetical protein
LVRRQASIFVYTITNVDLEKIVPKPITWTETKTGFSSSRGGFTIGLENNVWVIRDKFGDNVGGSEDLEATKAEALDMLTVRTKKCPECLEYSTSLVRRQRILMCLECADEDDLRVAFEKDLLSHCH